MKKFLALLLAATMMLAAIPALADVAQTVADAQALTHDELVEKALAETGNFVVYGNTSRITTALEAFCALYGITGEGNNLKDAEIYTKLESEVAGSGKGADMVMIQDGASLTYALEDGILVLIEADQQSYCLFVDELIGEQQTVIKPLPPYISRYRRWTKGIAGCTILGDGSISLILDINGLLQK